MDLKRVMQPPNERILVTPKSQSPKRIFNDGIPKSLIRGPNANGKQEEGRYLILQTKIFKTGQLLRINNDAKKLTLMIVDVKSGGKFKPSNKGMKSHREIFIGLIEDNSVIHGLEIAELECQIWKLLPM